MDMDTVDLIAAAYGRRTPRYPTIHETIGVVLALMWNRNVFPHQGLWLIPDRTGLTICSAAEAFAEAAAGRPSPPGWQGGALSSLRTLAGAALHETFEDWPQRDGGAAPFRRIWLDVEDVVEYRRITALPSWLCPYLRAVNDPAAGWDAMAARMSETYGVLCSWSSGYERPADSRRLRGLVDAARTLQPVGGKS